MSIVEWVGFFEIRRRWFGIAMVVFMLRPALLYSQSAEFYPLDLIKPGQKGYGKTVFEGTTIETFDVEFLGVLKNVGPKQDMILGRFFSDRLKHTGIFGGMSGSPVYVEDKLVGAVAYSFTFAKEPIAGITPIREIIEIFQEKPPRATRNSQKRDLDAIYQISDFKTLNLLPNFKTMQLEVESRYGRANNGEFRPIATPLNLSGFSPQSIQYFAPQFMALDLVSVRGLGSGRIDHYKDAPVAPGSTISVQLVRGDMDVSASGTVTYVSNNKIYAFGHSFLNIGYTNMPLSKAAVLTIIPSLMSSQKVSATTELIGSIKQDRATGILGIRGENPRLIPVRLRLLTSRNELRESNYEVMTDNFLTPFLMAFTVHNSIVSSERVIGEQTLKIKCTISVKGQSDVNFERSVSDLTNTSVLAALTASSPVNALLNSGFEDVVIEKIDMEITAIEQTREASLEMVWQDKLEAKAGEEVNLTVFLRKLNGKILTKKYPVRIPEEINPGPLKILVGDGLSLIKLDLEDDSQEFEPENLHQLIKAINNLKKNDRLYIRLFREKPGVIVNGEGLPDLPPSVLAFYNAEKTSGGVKFIRKVIYAEYELLPVDCVLKGHKVIKVNIKS